MSYTPNEWQRGDVVTSEKLNHMEQGIAESGGGYDGKIRLTFDEHAEISGGLLEDCTYDSILNALDTKKAANIIVYEHAEDELRNTIGSYTPSAVFNQRAVQDDPDIPAEDLAILVSFTNMVGNQVLMILPDNTVTVF